METRIKHVAICTENYDRMAEFYKSIFGMKKITNGMTDATGNYNPERGHISDGLIGYALLQRQPGISAGLDHLDSKSTMSRRPWKSFQRSIPTFWSRKLWITFRSPELEPMIPPAINSTFRKVRWQMFGRDTKKADGISREG
jgi:hypothetical protein